MKLSKTFHHQDVQGFRFGSSPFGKPSLFSHVYFVDGLLIDTGHPNMQAEVVAHLRPLPVQNIFITHHHEDHSGNLAAVQAVHQVPTFASSLCVDILKKPPKVSLAQRLFWGQNQAHHHIQPIEGKIETEHHQFELIPVPGHAVDMMALYEPQQGWLFSADLWVNDYIRYFMYNESMAQQIASLKKVAQLDFEALICSHNPKFDRGPERIKQKLAFLEEFYGKVAHLYHKGLSASAIMKAMGLQERWMIRLLSGGDLSTVNMIRSVMRDEKEKATHLLS
ncbi:MAG: MBL fold metallo-hydrolase [Bacteroidota bacterium]